MSLEDEIKAAALRAQAEAQGKAKRRVPQAPLLFEGDRTAVPKASPRPQPPSKPKPGGKGSPGRRVLCLDGQWRNMQQCWAWLFSRNSNDQYTKLTDEELLAEMQAAFPERESKLFMNVPKLRAMYNAGKLSGQNGRPKFRSFRYKRVGGDLYKVTSRGTAVAHVAERIKITLYRKEHRG